MWRHILSTIYHKEGDEPLPPHIQTHLDACPVCQNAIRKGKEELQQDISRRADELEVDHMPPFEPEEFITEL